MNLTKHIKSFSIVLLAALIISLPGILGTAAVSREPNRSILNHPVSTTVSSFKTEMGITLAVKNYDSNFSNGFYNFYDQLDDNQKAIYYELFNKLNPGTKKIEVKLVKKLTFEEGQDEQIRKDMTKIVQGALDAFLKDCPEFFWFDITGTQIEYGGEKDDTNIIISSITIHPAIFSIYSGDTMAAISRLKQEILNFPVKGTTRMERLRSIHDELARRVRYDHSEDRPASSYDAYGALVNGLAVCEGYSEAFKLICDKENIPCILVVGDAVTGEGTGPHMWNAVKMEDGKWYFIDATWDDQNDSEFGRIVYSCFLVGTNSPGGVFGKLKFGESHLISGYFTQNSKEFTYPPFAENSYKPAGSATVPTDSPNQTITPPSPLPPTTAQIVASTAPATSKTAAKTTVKKSDAAKSTKDAATTTSTRASESTTGAANISAFTNENGDASTTNPETFESGDENSITSRPTVKSIVIILVASALIGAGVIIVIIERSISKKR